MTKLYYPKELFDLTDRENWFELVKSKYRFEKDNKSIDINIQESIIWVEKEDEADVWILPMSWNYYFENKIQDKAFAYCDMAGISNKRVLSFSAGDYGITVQVGEHVTVYRQSGYRSKFKSNEKTIPFFLSDPVGRFLDDASELYNVRNIENPIVGFCGMAPDGFVISIKEKAHVLYENLRSYLRWSFEDSQKVLSSSNLRFKALKAFKESERFSTNYIIRQKYRGGNSSEENRTKTTLEYYQNQEESDLVICVRGKGNFSVRFYETLAMGRIPIFIDTDCLLPKIPHDWNEYIIKIDHTDIEKAPQAAYEWLSKRNIASQKKKNRQLWLDHFRLDHFWLNELKLL